MKVYAFRGFESPSLRSLDASTQSIRRAIAWNFACAYPDLLEQLIVLNIPHPAKFREGLQTRQQLLRSWYIFLFQVPWLPELILQWNHCKAIALMFMKTATNKEAFTPEDLEAYRSAADRPGALKAMINYYRAALQRNLGDDRPWGVLKVPTLMIWGEDDVALGKELTYGTGKYVQDLEIKYISDSGHWVQQEQPELVSRYMREFLQRKAAAPG